MGIQFEWQTGSDDGQWETIARTDRGRWLRRIPRWAWIVLVAVLVVSAGGGYVVVRRRYDQARHEIEFQIQSVIDLEARAFAQGDEDLFLAQQDDQWPDWYNFTNNWNAVCAGGGGVLALAMYEDLPVAKKALRIAERCIPNFMESVRKARGGWEEGIGYWNYGMCYAFRYLLSHERSTRRPHPLLLGKAFFI